MIKLLSRSTRRYAKPDIILEKLSHAPNSNNDNVLRKLDEIQSQLTELSSIQTEKVGDTDVQSHTATDYAGTNNVGSISTVRSLKELEDLGFTYESDSSELKCVVPIIWKIISKINNFFQENLPI